MTNSTALLDDLAVVQQNTLNDYLIALGVFIAIILVLKLIKVYVLHRIKKIAEKTETHYDDVFFEFIDPFSYNFFIIAGLYVASLLIALPKLVGDFFLYIFLFSIVYYSTKGLFKVVDFFVARKVKQKRATENGEGTSLLRVLGSIVKIAVVIIAVLLILSNVGFNISSLLAGVGIGGIAIAFAVQNILSDLFSSFTIYFDKPFQEGDFIIIGSDMGTIKHIGLKSTRIESLQGQELVVSNQELTSTRINNYKKMEKRRIVFQFGVEYSTTKAKLKKIPAIVRKIMKDEKDADIDRVHFQKFGDSSLDFEVVYYINTSDYNKYMDIQQKINYALFDAFDKEKISFAFPSRTVYLRNEG